MNLRRINYHCSCGSCDECTGGNALSYFEGMTQVPNIEQIVPIPGPAGEGSVLTAGKTSSAGVLNADGADEALDSTAKTNLAAAGFDIEVKSTTQNVVDTADLNNNKIWTGLSKGFLNLIGLKILPKLLPNFGTSGNIVKDNGTAWISAAPDWEKYNTTTTTSYGYSVSSIGIMQDFTVGAGLSYKFRHNIAIVDPADPTKFILGVVVGYSGVTLSVLIQDVSKTGNTNNWLVMLSAPPFLPSASDPANYGKFFYNNNGVIQMRSSIERVGDTKIWFSEVAPDTSWLLCDGTPLLNTEYPALYEVLVTNNGGATSPFRNGATGFFLPDATGAALVGVKSAGVDSITLGQIKGVNEYVLLGDNLPEVCPYPIVDPGHEHAYVNYPNTGDIGEGGTSASSNKTPVANPTSKIGTNVTIGNNSGNGGTAIDMRQRSLGMYLFIKAV